MSVGGNRPRRRKNYGEVVLPPKEIGFLKKVLWKVETQMPGGHCARSNHTTEDKLQGREVNNKLRNI